MKQTLLLLLLLPFFALQGFGTEVEVDSIYYDKEWKGVSNRHFADYLTIVEKNTVENSRKRFRGFYITGELQSEGSFTYVDKNDANMSIMGDGETIFYYKDGKVQSKYNYKNGNADGPFITYYENGLIREQGGYKDGTLDGEFIAYYENGEPAKGGKFINGKLDGLYTEINEEGLCFQQEYKNGEPASDYYVVTNKDGLFARVRTSDNKPIYENPSLNQRKYEKVNDKNWWYYSNDGVMVAMNVEYADDFGKYYRVYVTITNNSFSPMEFNPAYSQAILTEKNGKQKDLEIQTAQQYNNRIGRTQMWEEGFAALGESLDAKKKSYSQSSTATVRSNGSASVSSTMTYDANAALNAEAAANQRMANLKQNNLNRRQSKIENYVQKVTINPGQTYSGYFNIKRKNGTDLDVKVNVGGATYEFPWTIGKK